MSDITIQDTEACKYTHVNVHAADKILYFQLQLYVMNSDIFLSYPVLFYPKCCYEFCSQLMDGKRYFEKHQSRERKKGDTVCGRKKLQSNLI